MITTNFLFLIHYLMNEFSLFLINFNRLVNEINIIIKEIVNLSFHY